MEQEIKSIPELEQFAKEFLGQLHKKETGATIVGLRGDLGSGKTAFVKAVAGVLGITEEVLSPTFVIAKFYPLEHSAWQQLVHVDLYRIEAKEELRALKWDTIVSDPKNLLMIEWPEQMGELFPSDAAILKFRFIDESTRTIISENI